MESLILRNGQFCMLHLIQYFGDAHTILKLIFSLTMDYRIAWLRERILAYLGFEDNELFNNMLDANDGELHEKLMSFLNSPMCGSEGTLEKTLLHIHRTYYDKLVQVEKEITEWSTYIMSYCQRKVDISVLIVI